MARGCRGQPIFEHTADRLHFTNLLAQAVEEFGWTVFDWTLMPNHHHLLLRLEEQNLAAGMHQIHFKFAQLWNERHESTGHVFFRRYKNVHFIADEAARRVMKYIDLNPVRASLCELPDDWAWGGYAANVGEHRALPFHAHERGLTLMIPAASSAEEARVEYRRAVLDRLRVYRGRGSIDDVRPTLSEIVRPDEIDSVREANEVWRYSRRAIAAHIGCSPQTITNRLRRSKWT